MVGPLEQRVSTRLGRPAAAPFRVVELKHDGSFELGRRLDDDRINEVYEATSPAFPGRIVVQLLGRTLAAGPEATEACLHEVSLCARLRHPHMAWTHALGKTAEGIPYVMREYVEGETLRSQLFRGERISGHQAVRVINGLAAALAAAHQAGAIHGELRPSKIFMTEATGYAAGFTKVVDFGLWRLVPDRRGPGARADNTRFTAPELITGRRNVDGRADQFALAAILYSMLAGVDAFPGDDVAAVLRAVTRETPAPLGRVAGCEPMIDAVVRRGLAKEPRDRFDSVLQFAAAFEEAVASSLQENTRRTVLADIARVTMNPSGTVEVDTAVQVVSAAVLAATIEPPPIEPPSVELLTLEPPPPVLAPLPPPPQQPAAPVPPLDPISERFFEEGRQQEARGFFAETPPPYRGKLERPHVNHGPTLVLLLTLLFGAGGVAWWTDWRPPAELSFDSIRQTLSLLIGG